MIIALVVTANYHNYQHIEYTELSEYSLKWAGKITTLYGKTVRWNKKNLLIQDKNKKRLIKKFE